MSRTSTKSWKRIRAYWESEARKNGGVLVCGLCGDPIHVFLHRHPHDLSLHVDHLNPWYITRDDSLVRPEDTRPTHRHCNLRRSDGTKVSNEVNSTRAWY